MHTLPAPSLSLSLSNTHVHAHHMIRYMDRGQEHTQFETPRLQALLDEEDGILMPQHYVLTMCTPSRASLLTGLHAHKTGLQHFVLLASQPTGLPLSMTTLPELLQSAGYYTAITGKWHLGFARRDYLPTHRGFQTFYGQ